MVEEIIEYRNTVLPVSYTHLGPIRGKARPRVTRAGITYTPKETAQYENLVKLCFREAAAAHEVELFEKPVRAQLEVYYEIPKSTTKSRRGAMMMDRLYPCLLYTSTHRWEYHVKRRSFALDTNPSNEQKAFRQLFRSHRAYYSVLAGGTVLYNSH